MLAADLLLLGLAAHRLVSIWVGEKIAAPLREWSLTTFLRPLAGCPLCVSVWVSAGLYLALQFGGVIGLGLVAAFAISEVTILLEFILRKLTK